MSRPANPDWCHVSGVRMLPAEVGGAAAICAAIAHAVGDPSKLRTVELTIVSPYLMAAAVVTADGRRLPEIKVGSSDRPLGRRAVQRLAENIAARVSGRL